MKSVLILVFGEVESCEKVAELFTCGEVDVNLYSNGFELWGGHGTE
jgi:hypothetical protein